MRRLFLVTLLVTAACQSWQQRIFESKYAVNECLRSHYVDRREAERTIRFGGQAGSSYAPRCMMVDPGQDVTFSGDFSAFPLVAGEAPSILKEGGWRGDRGLFPVATSSGTTLTVSTKMPGLYGFYSSSAANMYGAIWVAGTPPRDARTCEASGGVWAQSGGKAGAQGLSICHVPARDAGKECSDSSECMSGVCFVGENMHAQKDAKGQCYQWIHELPFGCTAEVQRGKVGEVRCVD